MAAPAVAVPPRHDEAPPRTRPLAAWRAPLRHALVVVLSVRAGLSLLGLLAAGLVPGNQRVGVPGWPVTDPSSVWHTAFTALERSDALWYLRIASSGYRTDDGSAAFFPLYPMLVRAVGWLVGGHWLLAAFLVTHVALVAALAVLYRLTEDQWGAEAARRAILYVAVFPTGFFLFAPYTEALFLALSVGCLYAARRSAWLPAAGLAALAGLTRSQGILLAAPLAVEALLQLRGTAGSPWRRALDVGGRLLAAAAPLASLGVVALMWQQLAGDWRRPFDIQKTGWSKQSSWPWEPLLDGAKVARQFVGGYPGGWFAVDLLVVLLGLAAAVWASVRLRPTWAVYVWVSLLFPMTLMFPGRPLLSMPRFLAVLFPIAWALVRFGDRFRAHAAVLATSAAGFGILALMFMQSYPIF